MDLGGKDSQDRPGPRVAPLRILYHLALVYHRDVVAGLEIQLFRRRRDVGVPLPHVLLLSGGEAAVDPAVEKCLLGLHRKEPEGREIYPRLRPFQPFEALKGLPGVGPADVKDEMTLHGPGLGVLVLGI